MAFPTTTAADSYAWCNSVRFALGNDPGRQFLDDQIQTHGFLFLDEYLDNVFSKQPEESVIELVKTPGRRKDAPRRGPATASKMRAVVTMSPEDDEHVKENMVPPNAFQRALLQAKHEEQQDTDYAEYRDRASPFSDAPPPPLAGAFSPQRTNARLPSPKSKPIQRLQETESYSEPVPKPSRRAPSPSPEPLPPPVQALPTSRDEERPQHSHNKPLSRSLADPPAPISRAEPHPAPAAHRPVSRHESRLDSKPERKPVRVDQSSTPVVAPVATAESTAAVPEQIVRTRQPSVSQPKEQRHHTPAIERSDVARPPSRSHTYTPEPVRDLPAAEPVVAAPDAPSIQQPTWSAVAQSPLEPAPIVSRTMEDKVPRRAKTPVSEIHTSAPAPVDAPPQPEIAAARNPVPPPAASRSNTPAPSTSKLDDARPPSPAAHPAPRAPGLSRQHSLSSFPTLGSMGSVQQTKSLGAGLAHLTRTPGAPIVGPGAKRTSWLKRAREVKGMESVPGPRKTAGDSGAPGLVIAVKRKSDAMETPYASESTSQQPSVEKSEETRRRSKFAKMILDGDVATAREKDKGKEKERATTPSHAPFASTQQSDYQDYTTATKLDDVDRHPRPVDEDGYSTMDFTTATKLDDGPGWRQDYTANFTDYTTATKLDEGYTTRDFTTSNFTADYGQKVQGEDAMDTLQQALARLRKTGSSKSLAGAALAEAKKAAEARVAERRKEEGMPLDRSLDVEDPESELRSSRASEARTGEAQRALSEKAPEKRQSAESKPATPAAPVAPAKKGSVAGPVGSFQSEHEHVTPAAAAAQTTAPSSSNKGKEAVKNDAPATQPRPPSLALPSGPVFSKPPPLPTKQQAPLPPRENSPGRLFSGPQKEFSFKSFASTVFSAPPPPPEQAKKTAPLLSAQSTMDSVVSQSQSIFDGDGAPAWMAGTQDTEYSSGRTSADYKTAEDDDVEDSWLEDGGFMTQWQPANKSTTSTWSTTKSSQQGGDTGPLESAVKQARVPGGFDDDDQDDASDADNEDDDAEEEAIASELSMEIEADDEDDIRNLGKSTVSLVQPKAESRAETAEASSSHVGFFGQASKVLGSVFGGAKKTKPEPLKSLQLAAVAAKKEQEEKEKKASRLKEMEQRRQQALQRKAEEEKAQAMEEEKKKKTEDARKREREEHTDKRPLKLAKKDDDNTKKRKIEEKKPEVKKPPSKDSNRPIKSAMKQPTLAHKASTKFKPTSGVPVPSSSQSSTSSAAASTTKAPTVSTMASSQSSTTAVTHAATKTTVAPASTKTFKAPASNPPAAAPAAGKGKGKAKEPEEDLRQPAEVMQNQMASRVQAQMKAQLPKSENIELPDIASEYEDSDEEDRKKEFLPEWAQSPDVREQLRQQSTIDPDEIFGPVQPLVMERIFKARHSKFRARTSSANWSGPDELTRQEEKAYAKRMGFQP